MVKSLKDYDRPETCVCNSTDTTRVIPRTQAFSKIAASDWNSRQYNPAFGKAVSNLEAKRLAKEKGWVEVGNEPVEKIHSHYDKAREEKKERGYQDIVDSLTNLGEIA